METKGPALKDKLLEFFRRKKVDLPAAKDICCEILGETSVKKAVPVPLWASTITRQIDGIEEDIEAQLLERIKESPWYTIQLDKSPDVDKKATMLGFV